jgi:DNA-binding NtrC family response regulator
VATLEEVERRHIQQTLARLGGNLSQAARSLGVSLSTLKRRVKSFQSR